MLSLFPAREIFAIRFELPERAIYVPSNYDNPDKPNLVKDVQKTLKKIKATEYGAEAITAHLKGDVFVGVYPIQADSTVQWFALDFDGESAEEAQKQAEWQQELLETAGLPTYLERSQSGNGCHLWGFLEEPVSAARIRHALSPLIESAETYDRMFPNNDGVDETRPLGNLIALPLQGKRIEEGNSVFIDADPDLASQISFLQNTDRIPTSTIDILFEEAGQFKPERQRSLHTGESEVLTDSWKMTNRRHGSPFIRYCYDHATEINETMWYMLACQFAQFVDGRDLFHEWSEQDPVRYDPAATDRKYDQALRVNKPHSCEAIRSEWPDCRDDERFPDRVWRPYDLASISFLELVNTQDATTTKDNVGIVKAKEGVGRVRDRLKLIQDNPEKYLGYKYGIPPLDEHTRLRKNDMIVIAARAGMGKTAMVGHIINSLAEQGIAAGLISLEMTSEQFWMRQLSAKTGVNQNRMKYGKLTDADWEMIDEWFAELEDPTVYPVSVDEFSRGMEQIYESAGRMCHEAKGAFVLLIDYLQLIQKYDNEDDRRGVGRASTQSKDLAKALGIPVVALAQLNRGAEGADRDTKPNLGWLKDSGQIEQDADVIMFITGERGSGVIERILTLPKDRFGSAIEVETDFNQALMQFGEKGKWANSFHSDVRFENDAPSVAPDDEDLFDDIAPRQYDDDEVSIPLDSYIMQAAQQAAQTLVGRLENVTETTAQIPEGKATTGTVGKPGNEKWTLTFDEAQAQAAKKKEKTFAF